MSEKKKIQVIHFNNGTGGGVLSVIKNLIEYSQNADFENHVIYTIEKRSKPTIIDFPKASSVKMFHYDRNWNFYHTCKQLRKLVPDEKAVLVAHDWLELGMVSHLGMQNPVVQFLHGDFIYYYELAKKHYKAIDYHLCVSPVIERKLKQQLPEKADRITFSRFPVPDIEPKVKKGNSRLRLIYCVRDLNEERKQFDVLPEIQNLLVKKGVEVEWTIIGKGKTENEIGDLLGPNATYIAGAPNNQVLQEMTRHDLFLLPSLEEGFPVVVVEAMKAGLVPLTSHWSGAVEDLIIDGQSGFQFGVKDARGYADKIEFLNENREELQRIADNSICFSGKLFNPLFNTQETEAYFEKIRNRKPTKMPMRIYGSRLDKKWIPNKIVTILRKTPNTVGES